GRGRSARTIRVGGKTFAEQYTLARLLQHQLQQVGYDVEVVQNLGSSIIFSALAQGEIDLYVEYTGTVWVNHMHRQDIAPAWQVERIVAGWLAEEHGVRLAATLGFENAYALAMRRDHAEQLGIRSIADLAGHAGDFTIASDLEFFSRPEWHRLLETYDLNFGQTMSFDATFMYQALAQGEVEVITAFSSDGRIAAYDLVVLDDPQQAFPPYDAVVLLGPSAADDPKLVA